MVYTKSKRNGIGTFQQFEYTEKEENKVNYIY